MTDSDITMWRNTDPADGTWTLGRVILDERHALTTLDEADLQNLHALTGDILNLDGHDQTATAEDYSNDAIRVSPPSEEEQMLSNVWQAIALTQRIESLQAARREVRLGVIQTEIGKPSDEEINAHPLVVRLNAEIEDARAQMAILV